MKSIIYNFYCCEMLEINLQDHNLPIKYNNKVREYSIQYLNDKELINGIHYCPWCGTKFPQDLRDEYFDTLEKEYDLDLDVFEVQNDPRVPKKFKSDEWWKKRGL